jgi:hypothetical protein
MMNAATDVACAISAAAMTGLDRTGPTGWTRDRKRINNEEAYSRGDACNNWAEEFLSPMRSAEIGIDRHIAGTYICGMPKREVLERGQPPSAERSASQPPPQLCL